MMISYRMKRDGRTFDHETLEAIRLMAVERVREGESAAEVIAAYGFNRTTIYKWLKAALQPGVGVKALRSTKGEGSGAAGTTLDDKLTIACGTGAVRLTQVQRAGKQPMSADEFLRGTPVKSSVRVA